MPSIIFVLPGIYGPNNLVFKKNETTLFLREGSFVVEGTYEDAALSLYEYMTNSRRRFDKHPNYYPTGMASKNVDMDWKDDFKLEYTGEDPPEEFIKVKFAFDKICKMKAFV